MMNVTRSNLVPGPYRLLLSVLVLGILISTGAQAQLVCEVPLFVKTTTERANVMILADNSGSMNAPITHDDYDRTIEWDGTFDNDRTYYVSKSGYRVPNDFDAEWSGEPSALLVESDNGEDGRYSGNYLNWIYYHATEPQRLSIPNYTRIQVLKAVLYEVVDVSEQLRIGITV